MPTLSYHQQRHYSIKTSGLKGKRFGSFLSCWPSYSKNTPYSFSSLFFVFGGSFQMQFREGITRLSSAKPVSSHQHYAVCPAGSRGCRVSSSFRSHHASESPRSVSLLCTFVVLAHFFLLVQGRFLTTHGHSFPGVGRVFWCLFDWHFSAQQAQVLHNWTLWDDMGSSVSHWHCHDLVLLSLVTLKSSLPWGTFKF